VVATAAADVAPGETWVLATTSDADGTFAMVNRREFIAALGSIAAIAVLPGSAAGWVDPATVLAYRATFDQLRGRGQFVRPADVMPTLISELHTLTALARNAEPEVRAELYRLAARFAEYLGWMAQEFGRTDWTVAFTDRATALARRAGDDMTALRFLRIADVAMYADDPLRTIELSSRALAATEDPRVGGLAAQRLAQGHALANDRDACFRALDLSHELLRRTPADSSAARPVVGSATVEDHVAMATGWCLFDLGQPRDAADILSKEVRRLPGAAHRSRARYGIRLARCYATMGEIDQACVTAEPLLRRLPSLDSATVGVDVTGLTATLRRYHTRPDVRALLPLLAQTGSGAR
jgi:hypothetical protein